MSEMNLTLRIRANADGTLSVINGVGNSVQNMGHQAAQTENAMGRLSSSIARVGHYAVAAFGISWVGGKVKDMVMLADTMTLLDARIRIATSSLDDYRKANEGLTRISLQTGSSLEGNTALFGRLNKSVESMGLTYKDTLGLTKTLAEGLKISGASAGESTSVMIQLSQALASGVLRGDEFNSVMENGSRIVDALSAATGKSRGELRKMAEEGKLSAKVVVAALQSQAGAIAKDFGRIPLTIGMAMENVNTAFSRFIQKNNDGVGATGLLARGIDAAAKNMETLGNAAIIATGGLAGYFAAYNINALVSFTTAQWAATAALRAAHIAPLEAAANLTAANAAQAASALVAAQAQLGLATANQAAASGMGARMAATNALNVATVANIAATETATAATAANAAAQAGLTAATSLTARAMAGLRAVMLMLAGINPFTWIVAGVAAAATAAYLYRDTLINVGDSTATVGNVMESAWLTVRNAAVDALDGINAEFPGLSSAADATASFIGDVFSSAWRLVKDLAALAVDGVVGLFAGMGSALGVAAAGIVQRFADAFSKVKVLAAGAALGAEAALSGDLSFTDFNAALKIKVKSYEAVGQDMRAAFTQGFMDSQGTAAGLGASFDGLFKGISDGANTLHALDTLVKANADAAEGLKNKTVQLAGSQETAGAAHKKAAAAAKSHADAITHEIAALNDQHLKLTLSERDYQRHKLSALGMRDAVLASSMSLWDANKALEAQKTSGDKAKAELAALKDRYDQLTLSARAYFVNKTMAELGPEKAAPLIAQFDIPDTGHTPSLHPDDA